MSNLAPSTVLENKKSQNGLPDDFKKIVAQMVKEQVETQVATQMAAFKEAYKQEMLLELKKLVAAETQKQVAAQNKTTLNSNNSNAATINRIPAKVMRAMGSPKGEKKKQLSFDASSPPKTFRAVPPRTSAGSPRNVQSPTARDMTSRASQVVSQTKMPKSPSKNGIKIFKPNFE